MKNRFENAISYHYDKFPPKSINLNSILDSLINATEAIARYDQMLKNMHNSKILIAPLRNQEVVSTSRMEGTISTMDEVMRYEADYGNETITKNERSEVIETILYSRAMQLTQEAMQDGYPLSESLIKHTHQILLSFGRGSTKSPGQFKREQNYLGDRRNNITFIPISPEKLSEGLDKLFTYIEDDSVQILVKTAVAHLEFEALHPFNDGNGRIGRMLITLMLWKSKMVSAQHAPHFYLSSYFEDNKDEYLETMRNVSKNNDWESWCKFFFTAIAEQSAKNLEIIEQIQNLYESMKKELPNLVSSKWGVKALDFIFTNPVFRNSSLTHRSGIPIQTARTIIRIFVDNNILRLTEPASGRKAALYTFEPLMVLLRI